MAQTIIFQAKGGINEKSTVSITLFDRVNEHCPYMVEVNTYSYDKKLKDYLLCDTSMRYFYEYAEALEYYIRTLQLKLTFGYFIRQFQVKPVSTDL